MEFKDIEGKEIIGFRYKDGYLGLPWGPNCEDYIDCPGVILKPNIRRKDYVRVMFTLKNGNKEPKYYPLVELIEYIEANETPIDLDSLFKDIKNIR